jgi:hypothetical protein
VVPGEGPAMPEVLEKQQCAERDHYYGTGERGDT